MAAESHVWTLTGALEGDRPAWIDPLEATLSPDERARAARFRFERHRRQFIATRGALRILLGRHLDRAPAALRLTEGEHGKPALVGPDTGRVEFNVSHSGGVSLLALATAPVGIDIERVRPGVDLAGIADRFFAPVEREALASLPAECRLDAFFTCWTRKEAVLKAAGCGIAGGLSRCAVACDPEGPARLLATGPLDPPPDRWTLVDLAVPAGYRAAIALVAPHASVHYHDWPGS